ncbi:translation initiation factor IF-2 [Stratiformator vulcanicus]|uniref:Translation initiation factor IF-2 n=1 Tax=Stratiformator vulcanicus TaxID=2527980 RepID=A0A517R4V7_9PLAN|nr:translation initiation factor IF-2 [Stratiformator vulcanicus]QDT38880.1 Translation initiation factor IF-2 [Stratiformator vulcanicus]
MKIRIFALAKELGLDSKELIEHANAAGISVKNSALASISPEEKDIILEQLKSGSSSTATAVADEPAAPAPPPPDRSGKVRKLDQPAKRAAAKAEPIQEEPAPEEEAPQQAAEEPEVEQPVEQTAEPVAEADTETVVTEDAEADTPATAEEVESPVAETAEVEVPAAEPTAESKAPKAADDNADKVEETKAESAKEKLKQSGSGGLSPDEYVPSPHASRGKSSPREMRPVGTVQSNEQRARGEREKKRPQLARPAVAAPPKVPVSKPKPKADEAPAQKPEMPLTPEMLDRQSPLSAHMAQRTAEKDGVKRPRRGSTRMIDSPDDAQKQKRSRRPRRGRDDDDVPYGSRRRTLTRRKRTGPVEYSDAAVVELPMTVRTLSEAMGRPANQIIGTLMKQGVMVRINDALTEELALEVAMELGVELEIKRERDLEDELAAMLSDEYDEGAELEPRPCIVTILGHVDHGKTTMVDKLRSASVAAGEAGGITQHIAAYQVDHGDHRITFVDTPGHAAFGEMRARGANVTDIVVLVVAADDGVMPQTEECISHAKAAGVPIIVALNKMDLEGIDDQKILQQLATRELLPSEWGGDTEVIRTSGETGAGLDELLDTINITSELQELQTNPDRDAVGVCLEAFRDEGRGVISWLIVQKGTLEVGDVILCGSAHGRIRSMFDEHDNEIEAAGPSTPVKVTGLDKVPETGSHFFVLDEIEEAREVAEKRGHTGRSAYLAATARRPQTLEDILDQARGATVKNLPLIIKADSPGSIEAIRGEIEKFEHPEVRTAVIHSGVGGVNESDVSLSAASGAVILAFHVIADDRAALLADREGVEIRRYSIIYEVINDIRDALEGLLDPERREVQTGRAIVLQTFKTSRFGMIAGCRVLSGKVERNNRVHVIRQQTLVNTYPLASLRREKDDVKEVREGMECGIRLDGFNDIKEGDLLEAFKIEEHKRKLEDVPKKTEEDAEV